MTLPSMRISQMFLHTLRETPAEAELASHALLLRGGFIRRLAAGIYCYTPLGWRVLHKITNIIREEMNAAGGQEVLLPAVLPAELWKETGRWEEYGDLLAKLKDRQGREYCLGPTHEEAISDLVRQEVRSYKQLPVMLYQIQTKFRDELRPRGGLIRGREFLMKDLYSFHKSQDELDAAFDAMYQAYCRIFDRVGVQYSVVDAEGGAIGGTDTKEFMVIADSGEDAMLYCPACGYSANREKAECPADAATPAGEAKPLQKVSTPGMKTVKEVTAFLNVDATDLVKTLLYTTEQGVVAALVRGDREINEAKLQRACHAQTLAMADAKTVQHISQAEVGFAGPVGLSGVKLLADYEIQSMSNFVTGANETDAHMMNVNLKRDFQVDEFADIRFAEDGDICPKCKSSHLQLKHCIELGHIFKLGTKYSEAMHAVFQDEKGEVKPIIMGCYGIGVSRMLAAVVEVSHDEKGIIWPRSIAPFSVHLSLLDPNIPDLATVAEALYMELQAEGLDVLYDDRDERPGVKFADADLVGIPYHIVIGKRTQQSGQVEIQTRHDKSKTFVDTNETCGIVKQLLAA